MRITYLDCYAGLSGDMFLGALIDAGFDPGPMLKLLSEQGFLSASVTVRKISDQGIAATSVDIPSDTHHIHLPQIRSVMSHESIPHKVSQRALAILDRIVRAEAKVHDMPVDRVHLHEISDFDTIVDILGAAWGVESLMIDRIISSTLKVGSGTIRFSHGEFPVPAPATLEILKGIPFEAGSQPGERVTPTGAAIAAELVSEFGPIPSMSLERIGYGAGSRRDGTTPNVLRMLIGKTETPGMTAETLKMMETNIDDQSPEQLAFVCESLRRIPGVLDVHVVLSLMKKDRAAHLVRILLKPQAESDVVTVLFRESSSLGIRSWTVDRFSREREILTVDIGLDRIRVKKTGDHLAPEYEDCRLTSLKHGIPLKTVYDMALEKARISA